MTMNKDKPGIKKSFQTIKRCFQITEAADKGSTARLFLKLFPSVAQEYLHVFVSSSIINRIISGSKWTETIKFCIIAGLAELSLFLLIYSLDRRKGCHNFAYEQNKRKMLWEKMMGLDYVYVEDSETHIGLERAKKGMDMMQQLILQISFLAWGIIMLLAGLAAIAPLAFRAQANASGFSGFIQSPWGLAAVLLLVTASELIKTLVFHKKGSAVKAECNNDQHLIQQDRIFRFYAGSVCGNYRNGKEIRIYQEAPLICGELKESAEKLYHGVFGAIRKLSKYMLAFYLMNILSCLLMYGFAVARAVSGMLLAGEIIAFVMYFTRMQSGINQIGASLGNISLFLKYCQNALAFLDIPDQKYKGTIPTEKRDDDEYEFEFQNVSFRYPGAAEYALKDICLKWRIGEKMALVGKNGCGKSTLIKLLCRLYDPTEGKITLNGIDIRKYRYEDYMALFSIVFQDSRLFSFSIAENIAAAADYDIGKVMDCATRAGLGARLKGLKNGAGTCLYKDFDEGGIEISGGEAQKFCLARALYKGAPFIILDEPTAALDPISEYEVYTKFNSIVGTRTAVYISHRLSSCRFCDEITVMDSGRIAERGTHEELLAKKGAYYTLWRAQAEYYKDTAEELFE